MDPMGVLADQYVRRLSRDQFDVPRRSPEPRPGATPARRRRARPARAALRAFRRVASALIE